MIRVVERTKGRELGISLNNMSASSDASRNTKSVGEARGCGRRQGILDHLLSLVAQSSGRPLVGFLHVAVERLQIELHLAEVLGLELVALQVDGHQTIECPVEEEHIQGEVPFSD